jgi:photosystem II stability/assembly factor-like uncharacterized protein
MPHKKRLLLLVGTAKGLFILESDSDRKNWNLHPPRLPGWEVGAIHGEIRNGKPRLIAGTSSWPYGATIRISEDLGENWTQVEAGPGFAEDSGRKLERFWQIAPGHASQPDTLYAGVDQAALFVSHDAGHTWKENDALANHSTKPGWFPGGGGMCLHTILQDPSDAKRMWLGISAVGAFRTDDGGVSWIVCNNGLATVPTGQPPSEVGRCVHKMVLDPDKPGVLYQQFHGGVYKSEDAADSWTPITAGLPSVFGFPMSVTRNGDLFIVPLQSDEVRFMRDGRFAVYRSSNRGDTWTAMTSGLPEKGYHVGVLRDATSVDAHDDPGIYVGTTMGDLWQSRDGGTNWQQIPGKFPRIMMVRTWEIEV